MIRRSSSRSVCSSRAAMQAVVSGDSLARTPGPGAIEPMPEADIGKAVQLLDLMLEFFADDGHWTRGCYDDGNGGHCLVGALLHLSRQHRLPTAPAIALLQDAMPRPGLPLVHFNDTRCGSIAELRSVILKARRSRARQCGKRPRRGRGEDLAARPDRATTSCSGGRRSSSPPNASPPSSRLGSIRSRR